MRERTNKWVAVKAFWGDGSPRRSIVFVVENYSVAAMAKFIELNPAIFRPERPLATFSIAENPPDSLRSGRAVFHFDFEPEALKWRFHPILTWHNKAAFFRWLRARRRRLIGWGLVGRLADA